MSKKVKKYLSDYRSALENLNNAFQRSPTDDIVIDAAIKRFELSYELSWKLIKAYLVELGINCRNPRECFKQAKSNELIEDELAWLDMIEDRNLLIHTYSLDRSRELFSQIKNRHYNNLESLLYGISTKIENL